MSTTKFDISLAASSLADNIYQGHKYPEPKEINGREYWGDYFYSTINARVGKHKYSSEVYSKTVDILKNTYKFKIYS